MIGTSNEWKVRIDRPVCMDRLDFYMWRRVGDHSEVAQGDGQYLLVRDGEYMAKISPTFSLSGFDGRQMMHALAEALAEEGVKTPNDHRLQGIIEAQYAHLEDLRKLLKLSPKRDKV